MSRWLLATFVLAFLGGGPLAGAQGRPPEGREAGASGPKAGPAEAARAGAAFAGAAPEEQAVDRVSAASDAFRRAQVLYEAGDFAGAVELFRRAYDLRPHFTVQCNIALSYETMGDLVSAAEHYRHCLAEGAAETPNGAAVQNTLARIEARIGWVEVTSADPAGVVFVDGKQIGPAPQRVPLNPGAHVVEVRRHGATPATAEIRAWSGQARQLQLNPVALATPRPPAPPTGRRLRQRWFWAAAGLTGLLAVIGTGLGAKTLAVKSDYDDRPSGALLESGRDYRLATNVMWGLAAAAAASTTALFFYTDFGRSPAGESDGGAGERRVSLGIGGSF